MRRNADFKLQRGTLGAEQGFFAILRQGTGTKDRDNTVF